MPRNSDYKRELLEDLRKNREFAAEYLSAAKGDSQEAFLVALRDVAEARKGVQTLARSAGINRENLYGLLSKGGNFRIDTLDAVLDALGIETRFVAAHTRKRRRGKAA